MNGGPSAPAPQASWVDAICGEPGPEASQRTWGAGRAHRDRLVIGFLPGEGIGPEVTAGARTVLAAVEERFGFVVEARVGGAIGIECERDGGPALTREVVEWAAGVFAEGGAVLAGPGGGRFVYDLRREFDLFCKLNPIRPAAELDDVRRLKPEVVRGVDILVLRENVDGLYLGETRTSSDSGERRVEHVFGYGEAGVRRFLAAAARVAGRRRKRLAVIVKDGGLPEFAGLWRSVASEVAAGCGIECHFLDVDYACFLMVQEPAVFDVVAAPNCFGDIVSDMGGLLLGGRGLTFGASYAAGGEACYQTNHGAAFDLAGTDSANPLGHILSMAMMLRQSFGRGDAAAAVESAVRQVLGRGQRTADIATPGSEVVSMREMADLVAAEVRRTQLAAASG